MANQIDPFVTRLHAYIREDRQHYPGEGNNRFTFALAQAARYETFVLMILNRYREVADEWSRRTRVRLERARRHPGKHELTAEEIAESDEYHRLTQYLHLEIESFYIFAKMLLDKLALAIEHYFGKVHNARLAFISHDSLVKDFPAYKEAKALEVPDDFEKGLTDLSQRIVFFRDKQLSHAYSSRTMHGTGFGGDGKPYLTLTRIYPDDRDIAAATQSESPDDLIVSIEKHINLVIDLLVRNRAKSQYAQDPDRR